MNSKKAAHKESRLAFWMLAPAFGVVMAFVVFPVLWNLWISLKPVSLAGLRGDALFRLNPGLLNFRTVFSGPDFGTVLLTTLAYAAGGSLLSILLGLAAALLVHGGFCGQSLLRGLFMAPYMAPVVAVAYTWSFILDPQLGFLNAFAMDKGLFSRPLPFLSQRWLDVQVMGLHIPIPLSLICVILFEGWRYFPFAFLFTLARLQGIPEQLYHAASVDGATPLQRFFHITMPQLKTVLSTLFLFRFIWTFNKFDDIFLLTRGQAGTKTLPLEVYDYAFGRFDMGAGSATAMVLFGILALCIFVYFHWSMRSEN